MYFRILKEAVKDTNQLVKITFTKNIVPVLLLVGFGALILGGMFGALFIAEMIVSPIVTYMGWSKAAAFFFTVILGMGLAFCYVGYMLVLGMRLDELYKEHKRNKEMLFEELSR